MIQGTHDPFWGRGLFDILVRIGQHATKKLEAAAIASSVYRWRNLSGVKPPLLPLSGMAEAADLRYIGLRKPGSAGPESGELKNSPTHPKDLIAAL